MSGQLLIREARVGDEDAILALLHEFAEFERLAHTFRLTPEIIRRDFIGQVRRVQCDVAQSDGEIVAVMTWYRIYSTFQAAPGIFLEDIFVRPEFRGRGIGTAMLRHVVRHAAKEEATKVEWSVLDWNKVALDFYAGLNARPIEGWRSYRLSGDALERLANT